MRSLAARIQEAEASGGDGEAQLRSDLTALAEAVGSALQQVSDATRRQAQAQPPSLLQALLAPGELPADGMHDHMSLAPQWPCTRIQWLLPVHGWDGFMHGVGMDLGAVINMSFIARGPHPYDGALRGAQLIAQQHFASR